LGNSIQRETTRLDEGRAVAGKERKTYFCSGKYNAGGYNFQRSRNSDGVFGRSGHEGPFENNELTAGGNSSNADKNRNSGTFLAGSKSLVVSL
jgi:hypothetical protein